MRVFVCCLSFIISLLGFTQDRLFSCGDNGEIIEFNHQTCSTRSLGFYNVFGDIAVVSNGTIYGINDRLYRIDTISQTAIVISPPLIKNIGGLGLMALDDNTLLYDKSDSLFLYNIASNNESLLGIVGYKTSGDFTLFEGDIYMVSLENELIKITLNGNNSGIQTITNFGILNTNSLTAYSIYTTYLGCDSKDRGLFVIDEKTVYEVNETSAQVLELCSLQKQHLSYGSAVLYGKENDSFSELIPNVFTPNGDGVNDEYIIPSHGGILSFQIINRWGNVVYSWDSGPINWDGKMLDGKEVSEGIYFYRIQHMNCGEESIKTGHITLLR
jgi:gliding motility-associated-like protein